MHQHLSNLLCLLAREQNRRWTKTALHFAILSDGTSHVLGMRHIMHMHIPRLDTRDFKAYKRTFQHSANVPCVVKRSGSFGYHMHMHTHTHTHTHTQGSDENLAYQNQRGDRRGKIQLEMVQYSFLFNTFSNALTSTNTVCINKTFPYRKINGVDWY